MRLYKNFYFGGERVQPAATAMLDVVKPATETAPAHISMGNAEDANRAVTAARESFAALRYATPSSPIRPIPNSVPIFSGDW